MESLQKITSVLGAGQVRLSESMAKHTTFRIGGPAKIFFESRNPEEIKKAVGLCQENKMPYFVLGTGANLLVGDKGISGLVIRPSNNLVEVVGLPGRTVSPEGSKSSVAHYQPFETHKYLRFDDLDFPEPEPDTLVRVGAGVSLPVLVSWTLGKGLTGLQNFAGIPASIGGAIYNNIHGGTKLFDQFVERTTLLGEDGRIAVVGHGEMDFRYDHSRLQNTREIVLEATLRLAHGDINRARWVREEWLKRKLKIQPQTNCPGCIFKNLSPQEAERIGAPTVGVGWVIDVGLNLKGMKVGGISISEKHANFFVNDGHGRASDVLELIEICRQKAREKFSLSLAEEIQKVGDF